MIKEEGPKAAERSSSKKKLCVYAAFSLAGIAILVLILLTVKRSAETSTDTPGLLAGGKRTPNTSKPATTESGESEHSNVEATDPPPGSRCSYRNACLCVGAAAVLVVGYLTWPWFQSQTVTTPMNRKLQHDGGYVSELKRDEDCKDAGTVIRYTDKDGTVMNARDFATALSTDPQFQIAVNESLKESSASENGYFLKGPKIDVSTSGTDFYWVIKGSNFNKSADPAGFREHLRQGETRFPSQNGNPLVVPLDSNNSTERHIRDFVTKGDETSQKKFWKDVGDEFVDQLEQVDNGTLREFYPNTHGHAVPWLHMRFDRTDKFYKDYGAAIGGISTDPKEFYDQCF